METEDPFNEFEDENVHKEEAEYEIYTYEQLLTLQQKQISPIARLILSHYQWNTEKITNLFFEHDLAYLYKQARISNTCEIDEFFGDTYECPTCYDDVDLENTRIYTCGHRFCKTCWGEHISVKLGDGTTSIGCMDTKCNVRLDDNFIYEFLDSEAKVRYSRKIAENVVEENAHLKWCSSIPSCGHIVYSRNKDAMVQIYCPCGHSFCFSCYDDCHIPATCTMLKCWRKQCKDDSMTGEWLKVHTRDCPKCHKLIEKNGGCNHIACKCGHHFCYVCLGDFDSKSYQHNCVKFTDDQSKSDSVLKRYMYYYDRFKIHEDSRKKEGQVRINITKKMQEMYQSKAVASWFDNQWLKNAMEILFLCRRVLQYSFAFGYYLFDLSGSVNMTALKGVRSMSNQEIKVARGLFENLQELLENGTERLSGLIEKPLIELEKVKVDVFACSIEAEKRMNALVETIKNEILDISLGFNIPKILVMSNTSSTSKVILDYIPPTDFKKRYVDPPQVVKSKKPKVEERQPPRQIQAPRHRQLEEEVEDEMLQWLDEDAEFQLALARSLLEK
jgi:ariadne-1